MRKDIWRGIKVGIFARLGWSQEKISETVEINQQRISQITNNANFSKIGNLFFRGHDMESTTCSI